MLMKFTAGAGSSTEFQEKSDFFRLLATVTAVNLYFYSQGREVARAEAVGEGYAEEFGGGGFDKVLIQSADAQEIKFVMRLGNRVHYNAPPVGEVTVVNTAGAFIQAQKTVTNADGQLAAAKINRRYLLVQNNDVSGVIYITLDGSAATVAHGIKLGASESLELSSYCPTGEIRAIGSIASNDKIVFVEA